MKMLRVILIVLCINFQRFNSQSQEDFICACYLMLLYEFEHRMCDENHLIDPTAHFQVNCGILFFV